MVHAEVTGLKDIKRVMNKLTDDLAVKVTRESVRSATKIIHEEAIHLFDMYWHTRSGDLRKSIQLVKRKRIDGERVDKHTPTYSVMSKNLWKRKTYTSSTGEKIRVKGLVVEAPFYARFLEYGTSHIAAKPFIRPAAERKKDEAFNHFKSTLVKKAKEIVAKG